MTGPEFGPGGYLPPKASKRARKIVLREQMGQGWPLAAIAAAVLVAGAGLVYVLTANRPPGEPFVPVGALTEVPAGQADTLASEGAEALIVRAGGAVRAFRAEPDGVAWCAESRRLETPAAAWTPDGRVVYGDAESLTPLPTTVFDGEIYIDPTRELESPPPARGSEPPVCTKTSTS